MNSDEHKASLVRLLNRLGSVLHSTGVVVGPLAASYFASRRGAFLLTFAAHLQKTHTHTQHSGFGTWLAERVSLNQTVFTSFFPRFTSSNTSVTEKPNRSSNSGEFLQQRPEAKSCQTDKSWVRTKNQTWKGQEYYQKQLKFKKSEKKSLLAPAGVV